MKIPELNKGNLIYFEPNGSNFNEQIEILENLLINSGSSDVIIGNSAELPLTHTFCEGIYIREIVLKKDTIAIGKIHKLDHAFFLLKGTLVIFTENGIQEIIAPYYGTSPSGTKRVVYAKEECVFVNVHPNADNTQDIEQLENKFVVPSLEDYNQYKQLNN